MTETLLSPSNVLLFGRLVADLKIERPRRTPPTPQAKAKVDLVSRAETPLDPFTGLDTLPPKKKDTVLLTNQNNKEEHGIYVIQSKKVNGNDVFSLERSDRDLTDGDVIWIRKGAIVNKGTYWRTSIDPNGYESFAEIPVAVQNINDHSPFTETRTGGNRLLEGQLKVSEARFARIYGFSYEGTYYDLPRAVLFLVQGDGVPATEASANQKGVRKPSRAPGDPSLIGLAAAEFEFADDIMVWSYDKADYTIRMDVETGMFEQVLLDAFFSGGGTSGAMVSGAMVSGAMVGGSRGAMVRGAMVSGAMLRGRRGGRGDPSD